MSTVTFTREDLAKAQKIMARYENTPHEEIWTPLGLDGRIWRPGEQVIEDSPIIRFTPTNPLEIIDRICSDVFFLPDYGALIDLGDAYSTKALIESLDFRAVMRLKVLETE
ncbi:MAG: hypothetical protein ABIE94_00820 [archaeon]